MSFPEFWGVEVKPGQTLSCDPGKELIIHLSQAALGETKKGSVGVVVSAKFDDNKVIIGTLSSETCPQILCDLIFEKEFELSHSSETASVFLCGYKVAMPDLPESDSSKDEGGLKTVKNQVIINPIADEDDSDSSSDDDDLSSDDDLADDESSSEDESSEDDRISIEDYGISTEDDSSSKEASSEETDVSSEEIASSSEEDSSDEEDRNTTKKPEDGKKRVAETALKTPASDKKAKIATPSGQTTGDDGKSPHVATPHPAKQASEAPGNSDSKPKAKSPKPVGTHACKSCNRTFGSDSALQSHEKAKHA